MCSLDVRAAIIRTALVLTSVALASGAAAQDRSAGEEPACEVAMARLDAGEPARAARALAGEGADDATACVLAAWGRIADASGDRIRASVLYRRALAAAPSALVPRQAIERRDEALPARARRIAEAILAEGDLPGVPSLRALCEVVRAREESAYYDLDGARCDVVDRAPAGGVEAALLRVRASRVAMVESLRVAVRTPDGWREIDEAGAVRAGGGEYGEMSGSSSVVQVIPGGPPEIETIVRRWQSERDFAQCFTRRQREVHRHVCTSQDGEWTCRDFHVESLAGDTALHDARCIAPPWSAPPAWSIDVRFSADVVEIVPREGEAPSSITPPLGAHSVSDVFER